jgi:hypothetical protein
MGYFAFPGIRVGFYLGTYIASRSRLPVHTRLMAGGALCFPGDYPYTSDILYGMVYIVKLDEQNYSFASIGYVFAVFWHTVDYQYLFFNQYR